MNNKGVLFTILLLINTVLFIKLKFFIPQLIGGANLVDFQAYYRLVNDLLKGINPYTVSYMQTLGPPSVLFYFLPFSVFDFQIAKFLFTLISIVCGFAMCFVLAKYFFQNTHHPRSASLSAKATRDKSHTSEVITANLNVILIFTLIYFSSFPVRFSIEMGQPNLVIGFLVSLLLCSKKGRFWTTSNVANAGQNDNFTKIPYILASIIILKTNYAISLISLLKNNAKLAIKTFFSILCILIFLFPVIKPSIYTYYLAHKTSNLYPSANSSRQLNYYNQSIPARLNALGLGNVAIPIYVISALIILMCVYKKENIALGILASTILSPVSWQHYYAVLFPIFVITFINTTNIRYRFLLFVAYFLFWIEFPFLHNAPVNFFTAILSSHYLISAIILFMVIYKNMFLPHPASNDVK